MLILLVGKRGTPHPVHRVRDHEGPLETNRVMSIMRTCADVYYSTIYRASTRAKALRMPHRFAPISCTEASDVEANAVPYALPSTAYKR